MQLTDQWKSSVLSDRNNICIESVFASQEMNHQLQNEINVSGQACGQER